jgi:dGTPase
MQIIDRIELEKREQKQLSAFGMASAGSRGRETNEKPDLYRTDFQRDRDRILHTRAFRRLEYKTQVHVTSEADHFRTRLTHTLEVAQIARSLALSLGVNPDLTEAIALAHDLGHTPFGHGGETILAECISDVGGFEHNAQSLRVVEVLEHRFHDRPGLNLMWEVREGIASHSPARHLPEIRRYTDGILQPSMEAQIVDVADEIAYNHHDLDDALNLGLLGSRQLQEVNWIWDLWLETRKTLPDEVDSVHLQFRWLDVLMQQAVHDVLESTRSRIEQNNIVTIEDVQGFPSPLVTYSPNMTEKQRALRKMLLKCVYNHPATRRMEKRALGFFKKLVHLYLEHPEMLPREHQAGIDSWGVKRVVADTMSAMTDRECLKDYRQHFEPGGGDIGS